MFRSLWRFGVFNAVQSVCFDAVRFSYCVQERKRRSLKRLSEPQLFKTDQNVVVSAPTGSGKTVSFTLERYVRSVAQDYY